LEKRTPKEWPQKYDEDEGKPGYKSG